MLLACDQAPLAVLLSYGSLSCVVLGNQLAASVAIINTCMLSLHMFAHACNEARCASIHFMPQTQSIGDVPLLNEFVGSNASTGAPEANSNGGSVSYSFASADVRSYLHGKVASQPFHHMHLPCRKATSC